MFVKKKEHNTCIYITYLNIVILSSKYRLNTIVRNRTEH